MIYDYYGFPEHTYRIHYSAPGNPELAAQVVRGELSLARLKSVVRDERPEPVAAPEIAAPSVFPYAAPIEQPVGAASKPVAATPSAPISAQTAAIARAADSALTNARESLASSIDALASVLHEIDRPEAGAPLSQTDRANMAKWLVVARDKLRHLGGVLRQKSE